MIFLIISRELRIACTIAQMEREGGISPRLSPLAQVLRLEFSPEFINLNYEKYFFEDYYIHCHSCYFQVRDAGNLLTRAGFALPAVDVDEFTVRYESGKYRFREVEHLKSDSVLFVQNTNY